MGLIDIIKKTFASKCSSCGDTLTMSQQNKSLCISCEWAKSKISHNKELFILVTKEGTSYHFMYTGHTRYSPNRSSRSGYGSDDWMYLCKEGNKHYLLMFSDNAEYGTGWMCTELLDGDYAKMITEDAAVWNGMAYAKERTKTYGIRLTDVESVRHLLPTSSRCGKLTDEQYMR